MLHRLPLPPNDPVGEVIERDDIGALIAAESRPTPADRPWVVVNMVTSADGATTVGGVSGNLGSDIDMAVLGALRSVADVILAGSRTVAAERYRPAKVSVARREQRVGRGQAPVPRIAVVSNRGDIDVDLPLFADATADNRPLVLVAAHAISDERRQVLSAVADVIDAGDEVVDMHAAVRLLGDRAGAKTVVCEGGPTINGLLIAADLIDEWCLTLGSSLTGGESARASHGPVIGEPLPLELTRAWHIDSELLLRYVRSRQ
jgi:riboflavin biosynthesis pyrimidine reductase